MPVRSALVLTIWLTLVHTLLAYPLIESTLVIAPCKKVPVPGHARLNLGRPDSRSSPGINADFDNKVYPRISALPSEETEEQDWIDPQHDLEVTFLMPCSFRKVPDRLPIALLSILSLYHLRC